jgi:uncharacterized repeat protein (TIGR03803 family)
MDRRIWAMRDCALFLLCSSTAIALPAQTLTALHSFDNTDGSSPLAALAQAVNGDLYGTTFAGGVNGEGTVFKITPGGTLATLYSFCFQSGCADGAHPQAALLQSPDGNLYGTTGAGGVNDAGTVFKISATSTLTTLYSFCSQSGCTDGDDPEAALVQAADGNLYGTTLLGGAYGFGTIFRITPGGTLTTLYSFCSQSSCMDGRSPLAGLVQAADGNFYGTASGGGASDGGTVFRITPSGELTTLYNFCSQNGCTDGELPNGALVQAATGSLYGTTIYGGASSSCPNQPYGCGTLFEISPGGALTTLYNFCSRSGCTDGTFPYSGLIEATDGNLYGTTQSGGASGGGSLFKITPSGTLTTLYSFCSESGCRSGVNPFAALVQNTNGHFYGTVPGGGTGGDGIVFGLSEGLGPFVETEPTSGKAGRAVIILGTNLTGASRVTFGRMPAAFTIVSSSEITTTVPVGATTGKVHVLTSSGTLSSNVPFRVRP